MPRRLSISAAPLPTSRSTQPSTVGSRATSGLGGAAGADVAAATAVAGGATDPVTSFAATDAAATVTGAATDAARSFSTASLSLASLAAGSACAFSTLSRRSLVLLNWPVPTLDVCSTLAFSAAISASIRATEASSVLLFAAAGLTAVMWPRPAVASAPPSAPATVASATTAAIAAKRRLPEAGSVGAASAFELALSPFHGRSPGDMITTVPDECDVAGLAASTLGASAFGASAFGASALRASALGAVSCCSGAIFGDSTSAAAVAGVLAAGAAAPAPMVPGSPLK